MEALQTSARASEKSKPSSRHFLQPRTVTILGTYKCTAACSNCCFDSNPSLTQRLDLDQIIDFIDEAADLGSVSTVVFSGGECFLLGRDLVRAVEHSATRGMGTRCVSNGYWAKSKRRGYKTLKRLSEAGLAELNISTGDFHQEFVSEESVVNALELGIVCGLDKTVLVVEVRHGAKVTVKSLLENHRLKSLLDQYGSNRLGIIESPWMPMRADEVIEQDETRTLSRNTVHKRGGCDSIFSTIVLTPYNRVGVCCGLSRSLIPELNIERKQRALDEVLEESGADFFKIWLFVDGPERILSWAASKNPSIDWENRFSHHCHACLALFQNPEIRDTLLNHYHERIDDVLLRYNVLLRKQEMAEGVVYG